MKSTATSIHGQDKAEPARSHAGNPPRSYSHTGYLGQLAAAINESPGVQTQRKLAQEIQDCPQMQMQQQLASEINEGRSAAAQQASNEPANKASANVIQRVPIETLYLWGQEIKNFIKLPTGNLRILEIRKRINRLWEIALGLTAEEDPVPAQFVQDMQHIVEAMRKQINDDDAISVYDTNSFDFDLSAVLGELKGTHQEGVARSASLGTFSASSTSGLTSVVRTQLPLGTDEVLVQGDYMSGDRYSVAAALALSRDHGILVLIKDGDDAKGRELLSFYTEAIDSKQVGFCVTGDPQILYKTLLDAQGAAEFKKQLKTNVDFVSVTAGTSIVAEHYAQDPNASKEVVRKAWFGGRKSESLDEELKEWLANEIGMLPGKPYALLWVKTGAMTAEKSWHFTSRSAWEQLARQVQQKARTPVLVGEDVGFVTDIYLGQFWTNNNFRRIAGSGRIAQLRLLDLLTRTYDVLSVGMRSGILEGPALLGMRTIYLEEKGNQQPGRMEKWLHAMPNYIRVLLDAPPGKKQKEALASHLENVRLRLQKSEARTLEDNAYADLLETEVKKLRGKGYSEELNEVELLAIAKLMTVQGFRTVERVERFTEKNIPLKDQAAATLVKPSSQPLPQSSYGSSQPTHPPYPGAYAPFGGPQRVPSGAFYAPFYASPVFYPGYGLSQVPPSPIQSGVGYGPAYSYAPSYPPSPVQSGVVYGSPYGYGPSYVPSVSSGPLYGAYGGPPPLPVHESPSEPYPSRLQKSPPSYPEASQQGYASRSSQSKSAKAIPVQDPSTFLAKEELSRIWKEDAIGQTFLGRDDKTYRLENVFQGRFYFLAL